MKCRKCNNKAIAACQCGTCLQGRIEELESKLLAYQWISVEEMKRSIGQYVMVHNTVLDIITDGYVTDQWPDTKTHDVYMAIPPLSNQVPEQKKECDLPTLGISILDGLPYNVGKVSLLKECKWRHYHGTTAGTCEKLKCEHYGNPCSKRCTEAESEN